GVAGPERHALGAFGDREAPIGEPGETRVQQMTREAIDSGHGERRSGCVWTGLPLSQSLNAFQWMAVITPAVIQGWASRVWASGPPESSRRRSDIVASKIIPDPS